MTARHLVETSFSVSQETRNAQLNTRRNTAKVVVGLTVVFIISFVPYHICEIYIYSRLNVEHLIDFMNGEIDRFNNFLYPSLIVRYFLPINPCLNPVALFCTSHAFRRHFKRYLTCCCKPRPPPNDFELRRRN
jgi:hypothetical protein